MAFSSLRCTLAALLLSLGACASDDPGTKPGEDEPSEPAPEPGARVDAGKTDAGRPDAGRAGNDGGRADGTPVDASRDPVADEPDAAPETPVTPDAGRPEPVALPGARQLSTPPTYRGSSGGSSACSQTYRTAGHEPDDGKTIKRPLFLYFVGTEIVAADESSKYDCRAGEKVTAAMAQRGFYALSVEYDNKVGAFFTDKQPCLFKQENAEGLLATVCALPNVDCNLGIATWGHSQGALLAHAAANHDARVKAVWTTGYSGLTGAKLPFDRFRVVNGEADTMNAAFATIIKTAGLTASECPNAQADQCLRSDGSGFIIVRKSQCQVTAADHCWFDKRSCSDNAETLEPRWADADSDTAFALEANADWVAKTTLRK